MGSAISGVLGTSNNFSAGSAPLQTHTYAPNIEQLQNQQQSNYQLQLGLANQLQQLASGNGPNPALQMLQQGTNRAIQQGAGQLASTRGISPALAQRLAAQFGAQQSQAAAGQGAVLGAQQQQSALNQLGGLYGQIQSGTENMYGNVQNAVAAQNNALTGNQSNINTTNAGVAAGNQGVAAGLIGGGLNAVGGGLSGKAHGGMIENYASGGSVQPNYWNMGGGQAPQSQAGQFFNMGSNGNSALSQGVGNFATGLYNYLKPSMPTTPGPTIAGGPMDMTGSNPSPDLMANDPSIMASQGAMVPGKAQVKGDSLKNDTVPAALSPGEIVIPRHITMSPNAPELAAKFVEVELARHHHEAKKNYDEGGGVEPMPQTYPDVGGVSQVINQPPLANPNGLPFSGSPADQEIASQAKAERPGNWLQDLMPKGLQSEASASPMRTLNEMGEPNPDAGPAVGPQGESSKQATSMGTGDGGVQSHLKRLQSIYDQGLSDAKAAQAKGDQQLQDLDKQRADLMGAVEKGKVDPSRVWSNMHTGPKVATTIGLILSGLGSGLTGKPNMAMEVLNKHINDDIEAQKVDIQKNNNLLSANFRQTGDLRMAMEATRMQQRDQMMLQLQSAENNASDPMVKARAQNLMQQMQLQNEQTGMHLKMLSQMNAPGAMQSADPAQQVRMKVMQGVIPEKEQDNVLKDLEKVQNAHKMKQNMLQAFDQANKENTVGGRIMRGGFEPASVAAMQNLIMPILKDNEGRINEQELERVDKLIPRPGDAPTKVLEKKDALMKFIDAKSSSPRLDSYGIRVGGSQPAQGVEGLRVQKGWKK